MTRRENNVYILSSELVRAWSPMSGRSNADVDVTTSVISLSDRSPRPAAHPTTCIHPVPLYSIHRYAALPSFAE